MNKALSPDPLNVLMAADALAAEADELLHNAGLLAALTTVGRVRLHGSRLLGLMGRRELDVHVGCAAVTWAAWHALVTAVGERFPVEQASCYFTDRPFFDPGRNAPLAMGEVVLLWRGHRWKVDLAILRTDEVPDQPIGSTDGVSPYNEAILKAVSADPAKRLSILALKQATYGDPAFYRGHFRCFLSDADPRPNFYSGTIYDAVIHHGVRTVDEFKAWLRKTQGVELSTIAP
jgi:hypothetical protein